MLLKDVCDIIYPFFIKKPTEFQAKLVEKISNIEIHNLLNLPKDMRFRYKLVINIQHHAENINIISISIFKKFFDYEFNILDEDQAYYLQTIFLDDKLECMYKYDWKFIEKNVGFDEENDISNIKYDIDETDINLSYESFFTHFYPYIENDLFDEDDIIDLTDIENIRRISKFKSGLYFHKDDIRWQVYLRDIITSEIGDVGLIETCINSKNYRETNVFQSYLTQYDKNSIYEKILYDQFLLMCDKCHKKIFCFEDAIEKTFWHNDIAGDLCDKCFKKKKYRELFKKKRIKHLILNEGKKIIFQKELEKIKIFLEDYTFLELPLEKKYMIMKNINKEVSKTNLKNNVTCPVCLDVLNKDLSSNTCGHCFHTECVKNMNTCPVCRSSADFFKIYL